MNPDMSIPSQTNPYLQRVSKVDIKALHERITTQSSFRRLTPQVEVVEIVAPPPIIEGVEPTYDGYREFGEEDIGVEIVVEGPPDYFDRISADIEAALAVGEVDYDFVTPTVPAPVRTMMLVDEAGEDEFIIDLTEVVE